MREYRVGTSFVVWPEVWCSAVRRGVRRGLSTLAGLTCVRRHQLYRRLIGWYNTALKMTRESSWKKAGAWVAEEGEPMKVFISWSGTRSKAVAETLHTWLKDVMQAVEPWVSSGGIPKGTRWSYTLANELESTNVGIICLTPENLSSPWLLFEAGALSKLLKDTRVCTYLIGVERHAITGPFAEFQHTLATRDETQGMVKTINAVIEPQGRLSDDALNRAFNRCWPDLERRLKRLPEPEEAVQTRRSVEDMLQEVLEIVRDVAKSSPLPPARTLNQSA
jgi:TIR domain